MSYNVSVNLIHLAHNHFVSSVKSAPVKVAKPYIDFGIFISKVKNNIMWLAEKL